MIYESNYGLCHHGVLGMKWGVRHDPSRAYARASRKASKLKSKYEASARKASKLTSKAESTSHYLTEIGRGRAESNLKKAVRANNKAEQQRRKMERWNKKMNETFSTVKADSISETSIRKGEAFVNSVLNDKRQH